MEDMKVMCTFTGAFLKHCSNVSKWKTADFSVKRLVFRFSINKIIVLIAYIMHKSNANRDLFPRKKGKSITYVILIQMITPPTDAVWYYGVKHGMKATWWPSKHEQQDFEQPYYPGI